MNPEIREMTNNDLDRVLEIENLCFLEPYKKESILYELNDNKYCKSYVICLNGLVVGFAFLYCLFDQASLVQIATHPDYQKQGMATLLMNEILDDCYAQKMSIITLEVRENNAIAHDFYLKSGFKDAVFKERYYTNGDNAFYMTREIER
ncbi:MAG: ribosomal protein S18-alanine N-acetyltransferase [Coprobacillus sp.]|nr:ribosomal protein S18-alanine N-acetyltransferase [Coprobacillus sp.]